ncbi:hypothetical protein FRACYDRAFT_235418 [Fragilariopsis cylindrus CCMP1102]|uniref:Uncharacterized protein n=1 Tax=Fragilariopsis cylindrus CCMP1102 TaxID=635003 RepID=A0A1E7FMH0_9STRA|nr:hypothetical protein FRACYDRAFT_235418 [Fragilariopsis cylindrus CCMP1102]|eukprot:OEU19368.1 hypothetical protein FRACYDRAFT_235418 [Fragilariopsis cylindrus CCMP1102]
MANNVPPFPLAGHHLGALQLNTSVQQDVVNDATELIVALQSDGEQTNETLLELNAELADELDDIVDSQSKVSVLRVKVTNANAMDTIVRTRQQEATVELVHEKERFALGVKIVGAQLDLFLNQNGAPDAVSGGHHLYSMIQMFFVDFVNHPDMVTRHVRADRIPRANGNHRVGPTINWLKAHGVIESEGAGNTLKSGLTRAFARTLFLQPRFGINAELNDTDDDAAA